MFWSPVCSPSLHHHTEPYSQDGDTRHTQKKAQPFGCTLSRERHTCVTSHLFKYWNVEWAMIDIRSSLKTFSARFRCLLQKGINSQNVQCVLRIPATLSQSPISRKVTYYRHHAKTCFCYELSWIYEIISFKENKRNFLLVEISSRMA